MELKTLSNLEVVVLALYALGGEADAVSTEDVAVKANEIAPGRFAWKKYPGQINLEHIRVFLTDAKKEKNGRLVGGGNTTGWVLSDRGLEMAKRRAPMLGSVDLSREPISSKERHWRARERARIEEVLLERRITPASYRSTPRSDAEAVFRLDEYIAGEPRARIIYRYLNAFGDDEVLGPVIRALADSVRED
jgi:hypothetical protein